MIEKLRPTYTFTQNRLDALKAVVPEAFVDGQINWASLKEALGADTEEGGEAEYFGLTWPGKRAARRLAATPSHGTLRPAPGEGIDEATTHNLFIEGDNLEVLKLLQKSYAGRVKLIYIDPPYNTGNDFIYKDNFTEPLESYLRRTGQIGEEGELLTTNPKAGGRFHSNWLNMMYPRLRLARGLLRNDGLILISIDDNEVATLRLLLDEVFGEQNFVAELVWNSSTAGGIRSKHVNKNHEYALLYARSIDDLPTLFAPLSPEAIAQYKRQDDQGVYREKDFAWRNSSANQNQRYLVQCPDGQLVQPPPGYIFRFIRSTFDEALANGLVVFKQTSTTPLIDQAGNKARWNIYIKKYLDNGTGAPSSLLPKSLVGLSNAGTEELKELFGTVVFNNPKPTSYLNYLLEVGTESDSQDIVLDFFAGTCSAAHAVLQKNRQDGGDRRFILAQLPEATDNPQFPTIAEIGKERIRRVIVRIKQEAAGKLLTDRETPEDLGFKVFKLGRSHFKGWSFDAAQDDANHLSALLTLFDNAESPLTPGWQPEDLLVEILLQEGFPLDSRVTVQELYQPNCVWQVESDACAHRLFVCLDERLYADTIAGVERIVNGLFICLDTALSDEEKLRLADKCRLKVI